MPEVKHLAKMHVAYVTAVGPYGQTMPGHFARLFAWLEANHVQPLGPSLGIFYDDPQKVAPEKMHCDLCVPVAHDVVGPGEVQTKEIGDIDVATIVYQGDQDIQRAYTEVYDWLHAEGYHESGAPIETYLSKLGEELRAEVAIPIVRAAFKPAPQKPAPAKPAKKTTAKTARAKMRK